MMGSNQVRPKKHLGQHFLQDDNIARKIIGSITPGYENIVEIGAGTGILSKFLLADPNIKPWFFEVDRESVEYLHAHYPEIINRLINSDFLHYDLSSLPVPLLIVGNFPYNISSQILFRVLEYRERVAEVIGMFQKEVAERIASPPGSKKYGILSVLLQAYYEIEYLFTVNETVFYPPPKVKSAVIRLKRNNTEKLDCSEDLFIKVVKTAFNQRRKTIKNSIKGIMPPEFKNQAVSQNILTLSEKRPEQLSVQEFVLLTNALE